MLIMFGWTRGTRGGQGVGQGGLYIKIAAAQNEVALNYYHIHNGAALSYPRVRGLYFLAVGFAATIELLIKKRVG